MMRRNTDNLLMFAIGAATGAAVGILTAPKSGQETRQSLRRGVDHLVTRGGEAIIAVGRRTEEVKDRVEGAVNDVREVARHQGEVVKEAANIGNTAHKHGTRASAG